MNHYHLIRVVKGVNQVDIICNPTPYEFIGKGCQGAVFKLSPKKCVKVYTNERDRAKEQKVLEMAASSKFFPNLIESGKRHIVMEYIDGTTLEAYLKKEKKISKDITRQIIQLLKELKRLRIPRRDLKLRHIILTTDHQIKLIDHVNSFIKKRNPKKLFIGLKRLHLLSSFLNQVKELDLNLYNDWEKSMRYYF